MDKGCGKDSKKQFFLSHCHAQLVCDYIINTNKTSTGLWFSERGPQTYRIRKSEAGALAALQVTAMLAPLGEPLGQCTEARPLRETTSFKSFQTLKSESLCKRFSPPSAIVRSQYRSLFFLLLPHYHCHPVITTVITMSSPGCSISTNSIICNSR